MIWYVLFIVLRLFVMLFFLATSAYSILNYSPFVFTQFIRPRIFGWVNDFVASHHLWYCAAYACSVVTIVPELWRRKDLAPAEVLTRRVAIAYAVVFGLVAEWLVVTPYLPKLWNDQRSFIAALLSFLPVVWLAVIDHLAARSRSVGARQELAEPDDGEGGRAQRRLLLACLVTAAYLWTAHFVRASFRLAGDADVIGRIADAIWSLSLNLTAALMLFAVTNAIVAVAESTRRPRLWEYALSATLAGVAISGLLLYVVFPTIAFGRWQPLAVSITAGLALAAAWSGVALRRPSGARTHAAGGIDVLIAPIVPNERWLCAVAVIALPFATFAGLGAVERADWNFLVQKIIVVLEWVLAFGLVFSLTRAVKRTQWSTARAVAPPILVVLWLLALARVSERLPVWTGDPRREAEVSLDRYAGADLSFRLLYDALVQHPGRDAEFFRYLQVNTSVPTTVDLTPPDVRFAASLSPAKGKPPHIFFFILDSMRRDYLSPFNASVTFTPNIERFAAESFAFRNAFTHYGGTALAVPSIWAGGLVIHRTYMPDFHRSDSLEKLLDADGYRWFMSLDTHMGPLIESHPDLVQLDSPRGVMDFDFCRTMGELEEQISKAPADRSIFAFTLPQNLHVSNRQHGKVPSGERYPGFFEPYAAEVHRIDRCFGEFIEYLKRGKLYDDSIIVFTTDHGDSLGENGNWGHGVTIYPEVVRIPLIIHVPDRMRPHVTTDVARLTFSTDIVPTLYALLGHETRDLGPLFGSPLFVAPDRPLPSRRTDSFLEVSSYAATYGLLRHNGRALYIVDLVNGREYAFDLKEPIGVRTQVTDDMRHTNQRIMRAQIAQLASLYGYHPGQ